MTDNVYKVLMGDDAPFSGMANVSYYDKVVKGRIVKVHYDLMSKTGNSKAPWILNQQSYRTVDVQWMEGKPCTSEKVHIPELVSFMGYGLNYLPSVDDIVLLGFNPNEDPCIISILSRCSVFEHGALQNNLPALNEYGDPLIDTSIKRSIRPTPIRYIIPGEISLTSANMNSELYLDKYGAAKIIARQPVYAEPVSDNVLFDNGRQCGNRLWEISVGQDIVDEGTNLTKQSAFGNNVQVQVLGHQNGCRVDFDSEGNIELDNKETNIKINKDGNIDISVKAGEKVTITKNSIYLGDGTTDQAVLGNVLYDLLVELISAYNNHIHTGNLGFPTDSPSVTVMMKDILSKTVELK